MDNNMTLNAFQPSNRQYQCSDVGMHRYSIYTCGINYLNFQNLHMKIN